MTFTAILEIVKGFLGLSNKVAEEVHDSNQQAAGAARVIAVDNKATSDAARKALQAAVDTDAAAIDKRLSDSTF